MYLPPACRSYEASLLACEGNSFSVSNIEITRTSQKLLHFRVTTKDTDFPFHFHVLNLFKSWSNQGFDQDSNGPKNLEKIQKENEKPKHIAFLCHMYSKHSS